MVCVCLFKNHVSGHRRQVSSKHTDSVVQYAGTVSYECYPGHSLDCTVDRSKNFRATCVVANVSLAVSSVPASSPQTRRQKVAWEIPLAESVSSVTVQLQKEMLHTRTGLVCEGGDRETCCVSCGRELRACRLRQHLLHERTTRPIRRFCTGFLEVAALRTVAAKGRTPEVPLFLWPLG